MKKFLITGECRESFIFEDSQHRSNRLDVTMHNGLSMPRECVTFDLGPEDAKDLGEWLLAWAKEHMAECFICKKSALVDEMITIGGSYCHRGCEARRTLERSR